MHYADAIQKLWMQIDQLHLTLMDMEENTTKLDYKLKLEGCMKEYLSAVPLERRFYFQATNNVLYQTVLSRQDDFNPVRTAVAWDTLNTYASNLLTQPWRREFRELRLYCGIFKHQVEGHLVGAVEMLSLLGYRSGSGQRLTLEGPVDPDRVARVARDCLLAKTECQILRYIWEGVSSKYPTSWEEIVSFRRDYISTPEQAMRTILYRRREEEYYKQYGPPIHCPSDQRLPVSYPESIGRYPTTHPPYNPYPYSQAIHPTTASHEKENGYRNHASEIHPQYPQQDYLQPVPPARSVKGMKHTDYDQNMNEHKHHLLDSNVEDVGIKSPLIPLSVLQLSRDDAKTTDEQLSMLSITEKPKKGEQTPSTGSVQYSGGHTIWDYVYRDLESQGYSKDLGERGDVLDRCGTQDSGRDENQASFDEIDSRKGYAQDQRILIPGDDMGKLAREPRLGYREEQPLSDMDRNGEFCFEENAVEYSRVERREEEPATSKQNCGVNSRFEPKKAETVTVKVPDEKRKQKQEIEKRLKEDLDNFQSSTKVVQGVLSWTNGDKETVVRTENSSSNRKIENCKTKPKEPPSDVNEFDPLPRKDKGIGKKWGCNFCTYVNPPGVIACEICGKSKDLGPETAPLMSGGKECWKCTLVNSKEERICVACGASLEGSPTYI